MLVPGLGCIWCVTLPLVLWIDIKEVLKQVLYMGILVVYRILWTRPIQDATLSLSHPVENVQPIWSQISKRSTTILYKLFSQLRDPLPRKLKTAVAMMAVLNKTVCE